MSPRTPSRQKPAAKAPAGAPATAASPATAPLLELGIDELARRAGTTVRNVRAYQDKGLLPPPERRGRTGVYGREHLSRLRIIGQLLGRGYTLSSIAELLSAWAAGQDLASVFGLETAVASPWTDEEPGLFTLPDLVRMFGSFSPLWLVKAHRLGILSPDGARFYAPSPRLLHAGAALVQAGIPLDEMLDVVEKLRANVEVAAEAMVRLVEHHLFAPYGHGLPPGTEVERLGEVIWRLRPLVEMATRAEVARAMERAADKHLGDPPGARARTVPRQERRLQVRWRGHRRGRSRACDWTKSGVVRSPRCANGPHSATFSRSHASRVPRCGSRQLRSTRN